MRLKKAQHRRAAADLVGQGRQTDRHALLGIAFGLPVERLMLANFSNRIIARRLGPPATSDHMNGAGA